MKGIIVILIGMAGGILAASLEAHAEEACFIDGANVPRCMDTKGPPPGVSWPVYTDDDPTRVWLHSIMLNNGTYFPINLPTVKHIRIDTPEAYPDVTCFDFYHDGIKTAQTCFDTMEVTER